jgi:hypothetical protein
VLSGQDYFNRLNNPTPWTKRVPSSYFRDTARGICRVKFSTSHSDGGYLITLQFGPAPGRENDLEKALRHTLLPPLIDVPAVVGVHLGIADAAASDVDTKERAGRKVIIPKWLVMIEGTTPEGADAACDKLVAADLAKHGATPEQDRGLYMLQNCRVKNS